MPTTSVPNNKRGNDRLDQPDKDLADDVKFFCNQRHVMPEFNPGQHADEDPGSELILFESIQEIKNDRDPAQDKEKASGKV